jgi:hypothetical protein
VYDAPLGQFIVGLLWKGAPYPVVNSKAVPEHTKTVLQAMTAARRARTERFLPKANDVRMRQLPFEDRKAKIILKEFGLLETQPQ